jgi:uncharacterized membrane protein YgdD (TMEM256/DUF423 family)
MEPELIRLWGEAVVGRLATAAGILAFLVGAAGYYTFQSHHFVRGTLRWLGAAQQFFFHSRVSTLLEDMQTRKRQTQTRSATGLIVFSGKLRASGTLVRDPKTGKHLRIVEEVRRDFPALFYFLVSAAFIAVLVATENGISSWAMFPFQQFGNVGGVWQDSGSWWLTALKSVGYILFGVITFALIYTIGLATTIKSPLLAANFFSKHLSQRRFRFLLFIAFVLSGIVLIVLKFDW